ncbi:hypothetical protein MRB53_031986 [Persea americana]|uniref:Uncharacterized protein n=1 Tax=Persea americana TaxID=3435 RepID=A0ACC2KQL6_PERAE|nr:hypothetical protein MRB53_031986 [Persea americana]
MRASSSETTCPSLTQFQGLRLSVLLPRKPNYLLAYRHVAQPQYRAARTTLEASLTATWQKESCSAPATISSRVGFYCRLRLHVTAAPKAPPPPPPPLYSF